MSGGGPESVNPYAAPDSSADYAMGSEPFAGNLAERSTRLFAQLLDGFLALALAIPGFILFSMSSSITYAMEHEPLLLYAYVVPLPMLLSFYQWYLIATTGQSLGKKWLGVRILRQDGSLPGFVYGVVLRSWVLQAASSVCGLVNIIDALFIFREDRRCIHDMLAGTRVVKG